MGLPASPAPYRRGAALLAAALTVAGAPSAAAAPSAGPGRQVVPVADDQDSAGAAPATPRPPARRGAGEPARLAAGDAKKKKKAHKRKEEEGDAFGPDDIAAVDNNERNDSGAGVHREQIGVDKPYFNELSGSTSLAFLTVKTGSGSPQSMTDIDIAGAFLVILGHLELGPEVRFRSTQTTLDTVTTDPVTNKTTTTTSKATDSAYAVGPLLKINFGNIDHSSLVPFALAGVGYAATDTKAGSGPSVGSTGYAAHVGGGLNIFISSGVTFQPLLEYRLESAKPSNAPAGASTDATDTSGIHVAVGIGTFL